MSPKDMIWIYLNSEKEFNVYVLGHGLDIFIPLFLWTKPPSYAEITKDTIVADV